MNRFIQYLVERSLVVHLVSIFLVVIGFYAAVKINREAFPNVNLDQIQIDVTYPGATPSEVEQLIITPIEQELKMLDGIDKMLSVAFPGSGRITLEVDPDSPSRDQIASDTQIAVNRARLPHDLPNDPHVTEVKGTIFPIMRLAISGSRSDIEMKHLADRISDDLLEIQGVARAYTLGDRKEEIRVTVDPARLAQQRISVGEIAAALGAWNINAPGGDIQTATGQKQVRVVGEFRDARDAANLVLRANERGEGIRLADVATVTTALERPRMIYDVSGEAGASLLVLKKSEADIIDTVKLVDRYLDSIPVRYGDDIKVKKFQDFSYYAKMRLGVLTGNGLVGVVLVLITLLVFLRPSVALTTTWGLPIILFSGIYVLYAMGVTLNLISMFGFIMVLGMLVDDAVVIGENITYHMERGMKPREAAVKGTMEMMAPVATTVMTTMVAFLPLAFMSGILGKFIWSIPIVVIMLLALSWLESFLMLPSHVASVTNPHKHPPERQWLIALENAYGRALDVAVRHRAITVGVTAAVFVGSLVLAAKFMSFQLFPPVGVDEFHVRITAPAGTSLEKLREYSRAVDREIRGRIDPRYLEATVIENGEIAQDEGDPLTQRGGRFGQIRAIYISSVTRPEHNALDDMRLLTRELPPLFPHLDLAFTEQAGGPPVGRALEAEIAGSNTVAATAAAGRLMALLEQTPGVTSIDSGLTPGDAEIHVVLDRGLAAYVGIDLATAAQHVRAAVGGLVASTSRHGTKEVDVTIRYPESDTDSVRQLRRLLIPNQRGGLVPLERIAKFEERPGLTTVRHKDGMRVVRVVADIDNSQLTSVVLNKMVRDREAEWVGDAAAHVRVNYGGEEEKNQESFNELMASFLFAAIAIFFILAILFNNLGYPLIVMSTIPLGIVGVILAFFVHDKLAGPMPLSFMSTLGTVALTGVVVNSAIVLLSFVQRAREMGVEAHEAIMQAGRRRLRAVIVTGATTVVGLLPTAYGWGGKDPFVAPMALALGWGLAFSTVISLFVVPATIALAIDAKVWVRGLFQRQQPYAGKRR